MSFWQKLIAMWFTLLLVFVPLIWLSNSSELFEFNKIILTYVLAILIGASWITRMIAEKRWIFHRTPLDIPIGVFLVIQLLGWAVSIDPRVSWIGYYSRWNGGVLSLLVYALLYWSYVSNMTRKSTVQLLNWSLTSAGVVSIYAGLEHFGHSFSCALTTGKFDVACWVQDVQNRVFGTIGQPNWLGAYLTALIFIPMSAVISNFQFSNSKQFSKFQISNFLIFILLFTVLLFTKSRSGLLAFGMGGVIYGGLVIWKEKAKIFKNYLLYVICGFVIVATLTIGNPIKDLVFKSKTPALPLSGSSTQLEIGGTESGTIRKIVWTGATKIWRSNIKNLILGTGPETFAMAYYQYRPIEHNQTSEWELLYNKAHNEFLNYLATTGLLGLLSYLVFLITMGYSMLNAKRLSIEHYALSIALFTGWLTISITNFWGFSVVVTQLLLFLLPAMGQILNAQDEKPKDINLSGLQILFMVFVFCGASCLLYVTGRYWLADVYYARGQNAFRYFGATQKSEYLLSSYQDLMSAYKLNKREPAILSELGSTAAYIASALRESDATTSANLAELALQSAKQAVAISQHHPNYYKSASKTAILLSDLNLSYLDLAYSYLQQAQKLSPTDPRIYFNLGVIASYQNKSDLARQNYEMSIKLKPDFADPRLKLQELLSNN